MRHRSARLRSSCESPKPAFSCRVRSAILRRAASVKGNPPVRRIDNEGRALVFGQPVAALVPELVVGQHAAFSSRCVPRARLPFYRVEQIAIEPRVLRRFERRRLLLRSSVAFPASASGRWSGVIVLNE